MVKIRSTAVATPSSLTIAAYLPLLISLIPRMMSWCTSDCLCRRYNSDPGSAFYWIEILKMQLVTIQVLNNHVKLKWLVYFSYMAQPLLCYGRVGPQYLCPPHIDDASCRHPGPNTVYLLPAAPPYYWKAAEAWERWASLSDLSDMRCRRLASLSSTCQQLSVQRRYEALTPRLSEK